MTPCERLLFCTKCDRQSDASTTSTGRMAFTCQFCRCEVWSRRNRAAVDALIRQWTPLVHHVMRRHRVHGDDYLSIGMLKLMLAARQFDDRRGVQFKTYAFTSIGRGIYREKEEAKKYATTRQHVQFENDRDDTSAETLIHDWRELDPLDRLERGERAEMVQDALLQLDPRRRVVARLRVMEEQRLKDVGQTLGICGEWVRQMELSAGEQLRELLGDVGQA